jgi:hypothetical protein
MASIIGEKKFRAASGDGWKVADKVFGYLDETVNIYNKARSGIVEGDLEYRLGDDEYRQIGVFGLPKPWGGLLILGGVLMVGIILIKVAK